MSQDAKNATDLLDWAETLLRDCQPPSFVPVEAWREFIQSWIDQKRSLVIPNRGVLGNPETTPTQLPVELKEELL